MKEISQENDRYLRQDLFINNRMLTKERNKTFKETLNMATDPVPSRKISHQGDPFVTNLKSVSQLMISNRSNVRKNLMISVDVCSLILCMKKLIQKINPVKMIKRRNPTGKLRPLLNIRRFQLWSIFLNIIIMRKPFTEKQPLSKS